jgi:CRP-like cAMP-binding protein
VADTDTLARNRLLAMIPDEERARLAPDFEVVTLDLRAHLHRENEPIEQVYFPISGVLSLVSQMEDGRAVEVATVGNEGMIGLPKVARQLQDAGAIDYTRGRVTILDRAALESRSCECYRVVRTEFDRLPGVGDPGPVDELATRSQNTRKPARIPPVVGPRRSAAATSATTSTEVTAVRSVRSQRGASRRASTSPPPRGSAWYASASEIAAATAHVHFRPGVRPAPPGDA